MEYLNLIVRPTLLNHITVSEQTLTPKGQVSLAQAAAVSQSTLSRSSGAEPEVTSPRNLHCAKNLEVRKHWTGVFTSVQFNQTTPTAVALGRGLHLQRSQMKGSVLASPAGREVK